MAQEEKVKAYDEAIEKAKKILETPYTAGWDKMKDLIVHIFPELRESEDERIRKDIIEHFKYEIEELSNKGEEYKAEVEELSKYIAYLERQKDINCLACDQHLKGYVAGRKVTEEEKQKEQKPIQETVNISGVEYVDLGLPSGTLWAKENIDGYYTWDEAKEKFGDSLPSPEQSNELYNNCEWEWSIKKKGFTVTGPNGNSIFLPAGGYRVRGDGSLYRVGSYGYYWLSAAGSQTNARRLSFDSGAVSPQNTSYRAFGFSVRPCGVPQNFKKFLTRASVLG